MFEDYKVEEIFTILKNYYYEIYQEEIEVRLGHAKNPKETYNIELAFQIVRKVKTYGIEKELLENLFVRDIEEILAKSYLKNGYEITMVSGNYDEWLDKRFEENCVGLRVYYRKKEVKSRSLTLSNIPFFTKNSLV